MLRFALLTICFSGAILADFSLLASENPSDLTSLIALVFLLGAALIWASPLQPLHNHRGTSDLA
jgi:hypothetical protein